MELNWTVGSNRKAEKSPVTQAEISPMIEDVEQARETPLGAVPIENSTKEPSPWSCFYCSANVKVSESAIKALKSGEEKKESDHINNNEDVKRTISNYHNYQQRKTFGQGLMDLALLTANINQLRSLLDDKDKHPYYCANLSFIGISISFQVFVGIGLILNSRKYVNDESDVNHVSRLNNWTIIGTFIITITNMFLTVFYDNKKI